MAMFQTPPLIPPEARIHQPKAEDSGKESSWIKRKLYRIKVKAQEEAAKERGAEAPSRAVSRRQSLIEYEEKRSTSQVLAATRQVFTQLANSYTNTIILPTYEIPAYTIPELQNGYESTNGQSQGNTRPVQEQRRGLRTGETESDSERSTDNARVRTEEASRTEDTDVGRLRLEKTVEEDDNEYNTGDNIRPERGIERERR